MIRDAHDALAYALSRLPGTYAAATAVLEETRRRCPDFRPASLLDAGAGPGGAAWAAAAVWPEIDQAVRLDANPAFLDLAARLAQAGPKALADAEAVRADLTSAGPWPHADLVLAAYVLAELPDAAQAAVVARLWDASRGLLVLVEPGTPAGYGRILAARGRLIAAGGRIVAPCPHDRPCPLEGADWCHFAVRLPRSRDQQLAKGATAPFEDEKFAYLVAARPEVQARPAAGRVLAPPRAGKPGISLKVCGPDGLEARFAPARDRARLARARRLDWGDAIEDEAT